MAAFLLTSNKTLPIFLLFLCRFVGFRTLRVIRDSPLGNFDAQYPKPALEEYESSAPLTAGPQRSGNVCQLGIVGDVVFVMNPLCAFRGLAYIHLPLICPDYNPRMRDVGIHGGEQ